MSKLKTKEEFLEELFLNNVFYKNGDFSIIDEYKGNHTLIKIKTKYGECNVYPSNLLRGVEPTITSAINKTQYFINMCVDKFGPEENDSFEEFIYISSDKKSKFIDKDHGFYYLEPNKYYCGRRHKNIKAINAGNRLRREQNQVFSDIEKIHPGLKVITNQKFISGEKHIFIENKYGICRVKPSHLLCGNKPAIMSAINKNEYFINKAKEVHGNKYDYSLVNYINSRIKVKIISEYGIFEQTPGVHLSGSGCPISGILNNCASWSYSSWFKNSNNSKNFNGYKVYFLECWDNETKEKFYKIGRTYTDLKVRFSGYKKFPYLYNILYYIKLEDYKKICELEQKYKKMHEEFKYTPIKKFGGYQECFSKIIYI